MAREVMVRLSNGDVLTISKEHEAELSDAMSKDARAITVRDHTGARRLLNVGR